MHWKTLTLQNNSDHISERFIILFKQILRLREWQIRKWVTGHYQDRSNKLIEKTLVELQYESENIGLTWFSVLIELQRQGFKKNL